LKRASYGIRVRAEVVKAVQSHSGDREEKPKGGTYAKQPEEGCEAAFPAPMGAIRTVGDLEF